MTVTVSPGGRVACAATLDLPMPASAAWGQLRDFGRYARHDPFHAGFRIARGVASAGASLEIDHRLGPFRVRRVGRVLSWREWDGRSAGYAFSDLSTAGPRRGLPHVFSYRLTATGPHACRLLVRVGGRWTAPTPHWIARLWLGWVFAVVVTRVRNGLLRFALARRLRCDAPPPCPDAATSPAPTT